LVRPAEHQDSTGRDLGRDPRAANRARARRRGDGAHEDLVEGHPDLQTVALRLAFIAAALIAWFVTQRMIGARSLPDGAVYDHLHVITERWNAWLNRNPRAANAILVASSLAVDA